MTLGRGYVPNTVGLSMSHRYTCPRRLSRMICAHVFVLRQRPGIQLTCIDGIRVLRLHPADRSSRKLQSGGCRRVRRQKFSDIGVIGPLPRKDVGS